MDKTTNQIESDIERKRDELGANLNELEHKVKQIGDWRHHFDNHPMTLIGAAFGGGMVLATMLGRSRRDTPTYSATSPRSQKALDTWDHIKDALIGRCHVWTIPGSGAVPDWHRASVVVGRRPIAPGVGKARN